MFYFKTTTPIKRMTEGRIRLSLLSQCQSIHKKILGDFEKTVKTWNHKVVFTGGSSSSGGVQLKSGNIVFSISTDDDIYHRVDYGMPSPEPNAETEDGKRVIATIEYINSQERAKREFKHEKRKKDWWKQEERKHRFAVNKPTEEWIRRSAKQSTHFDDPMERDYIDTYHTRPMKIWDVWEPKTMANMIDSKKGSSRDDSNAVPRMWIRPHPITARGFSEVITAKWARLLPAEFRAIFNFVFAKHGLI
jgi:hypothetical protein